MSKKSKKIKEKEQELPLSGKKVLFLLAGGFLIYFLATQWIGLEQIMKVLQKADLKIFILAILAEVVAYSGTGLLIYSILDNIKIKTINFITSFKLGTITALAIHSLPVSVLGEAAFNYYLLRKKQVPTGKILGLLVTRLIFSYSAFFVILGGALLVMPTFADVSTAGKIASLVVLLFLIIGIIFARNLYLNFQRFQVVMGKIVSFLDRIKKRLLNRSRLTEKQKKWVIKDIHHGFSPLDSPFSFLKQTGIAAIYWIGDMSTLFLVLLSLGVFLNPAKLIVAYGVATTLGAISFIPGGLGVIEGALGLMLVNLGVPVEITITAVIGYRLISFWLMIPVGVYSTYSLNSGNKKEDLANDKDSVKVKGDDKKTDQSNKEE